MGETRIAGMDDEAARRYRAMPLDDDGTRYAMDSKSYTEREHREYVRDAFERGMQLGAKVEHDEAVRALATAALAVLGKDRGDGVVDLGALGRWYSASTVDGLATPA